MNESSAGDPLSVFGGISMPVYVVDAARCIVFVNRACAELLGHPVESLRGLACHDVSTSSEPLAALAASLCPPPNVLAGDTAEGDVRIPTRDGRLLEWRVRWQPSYDASGHVLGAVAWLPPLAVRDGSRPHTSDWHERLARLRQELAKRHRFDQLICQSAVMRPVLEQVKLAAGCDVPVLVRGERGTGKELVARTIHYTSRRRDGSPVAVDCAALPPEVVDRTLERLLRRPSDDEPPYLQGPGLAGGTLLILEVSEMPRDAQAKLMTHLRAADDREALAATEPGGESTTAGGAQRAAPTGEPPRLIATTSADLAAARADGKLRDELYYALRTLVIELPPLRERREDIAPLAQHFLEQQNARGGHQIASIAKEALDLLLAYDWLGNVHELAQTIAAAHARAGQAEAAQAAGGQPGTCLLARDLPHRLRSALDAAVLAPPPDPHIPLDELLVRAESKLIRLALSRARGNKSQAADLLGISRPRLHRRMVQLGIEAAGAGKSAQSEPDAPAPDDGTLEVG